jgi:hypothetical protein
MKLTAGEYRGCFAFELEPESIAEAALLTRFALNSTKELRAAQTFANEDGFRTSIVIGKLKNPISGVKR